MTAADLPLRRRAALAVVLAALPGCGASPTRTTVNIAAAAGINPNADQQPSPTVVRVYELKSVDTFNQLQFFDLFDQDVAKLGGDLLNRREIEIQPGKSVTWQRDADPAALFIGAIAGYRELANITWRAAVPLRVEERNTINLRLDAHSMTIAAVPPRRFLGIM